MTAAGPAGNSPARGQAARGQEVPGALLLDLVAAVLQAGAPPAAALEAVGHSLQRAGDARGQLLLAAATGLGGTSGGQFQLDDEGDDEGGEEGDGSCGAWYDGRSTAGRGQAAPDPTVAALVEGLDLAVRAGIGPAAMVRRAAEQRRRRQAFAQQAAIRKLEIWLVAPAGLCWLPAFVLVGVVPLVIDLIHG